MKHKRNFTLSAIVSIGLVNLIAFGTGLTAAAFINYELQSQEIHIDLGYSQYFSSIDPNKPADGSQANPYLITNATQLRNLSSLVNLGVFGPNDYFRIPKEGFTYDNIPLTPIGSDQQPFMSHLDGECDLLNTPNIVPVISNLIVEGNNLPDVGMFGYIGNSATVSNFILDNPIIRSYEKITDTTYRPANEGFDYADIDANPLRDITYNNEPIFSTKNCKTINLTTIDDIKTNKVIHNFEIDVSHIDKLITDSKQNINLYPIISDTNLIHQPDPINSPFKFVTAKNVPIPLKPDGKGELEGKYCTISIAVSGVAPFKDEYRFSTMILERYKLFFNYDETSTKEGIIADENDFKTYGKMKFPDPYYIETEVIDETTEEQYSGYVKYDEARALYVGIIAGQIDGDASRIGVKTPKLDIQRPFISNSLLFGKTIDDTNKRTLSHEEFKTENVLKSPILTYKWIEPKMIDYLRGNGNSIPDPDYRTGNNYVSDIYDLDPINNPKQGFTRSAQNIIRIYADNQQGASQQNAPNGTGVIGVKDNISYYNPISKQDEMYEENAISIQKPMDVKLHNFVSRTKEGTTKVGYTNILASNAIQLWVSSQHTKSRVNDWFNGSVDFYLDCEMEYLYFDDQQQETTIPTVSGNFNAYNILTVYAGEKSIRMQQLFGKGKRVHNYILPRTIPVANAVENVEFEKLSDSIFYKTSDDITEVNNNYYAYPFAYLDNTINEEGNEVSGFNALKLIKSDTLANAQNSQNIAGYKPNLLKFSISANKIFRKKIKNDLPSRIKKGFFPIFFLGLPDRSKINSNLNNNCRLDILSMKVTLSNKRGNIDSSTGTVDYISGTTLPLKGKALTFWNGTGVKISAQTIKNSENLKNPPTLPIPHFININPEVNVSGGNHYYISISRNPGTTIVSVKYNPYNLANVTSIDTRDTPGFKISNPVLDNKLSF